VARQKSRSQEDESPLPWLWSVGWCRRFATFFHNRKIRDERSAQIASTVATFFRQVDDDSTKSVEIRPIILPPGALDTKQPGSRQDRKMGGHRILRHLASSGDVTGADRSWVRGGEAPKCRHARNLRERGEGLDNGALIDESRHAD
jgi:hypothetical protein